MSMGTGKTKVALDLICSKAHKVDYILWICPCALKNEIETERQKWQPQLTLDVVGCESIGSSDRIYLETLRKVESGRAFIVVDESLKIKNRLAKRTQRIIKLGEKAEYKLILNGTPISKSYCDLWAQMEFLSPKILQMSYTMFYNTYCEYYTRGKLKGKIRSFVNIPHLIDKIAPYVFEADLEIETEKKYETYFFLTDGEEYEQYKNDVFLSFYNNSMNDLNFYAFTTKLQRWYTENSNRAAVLQKIIRNIDDKVIVFVRFLASIPADAQRITGAENMKQRKEILKDFENGKFKVLYITFGCGSFGLNLQFCKHMIFAENIWDYAVKEQAEARIYRIGAGKEVTYYGLTCENVGLESLMLKCIERKSNMLDTVKREIQKCGSIKELVKKL